MKRCRMSKHVLHTGKHFAVGVKCGAWVICVPLAAVQPARRLGAHPGLVLPGARLALGLLHKAPGWDEIASSRRLLRPPAPREASVRGS